jgi:predicted nucleotidyltransferase
MRLSSCCKQQRSNPQMKHDTGLEPSDVLELDRSHCQWYLDNPVIAEHLEGIRALCREYGVLRLEIFGSACTPEFDPERSDIDFLVEYPDDYDFGPWATRLQELQEDLTALLGRRVDLLLTRAIRKKYFLLSVAETRELVYAA